MKRIVRRRTEITIETHQRITWRACVTTGTDPEPPQAPDERPDVLLFSEEPLPASGADPNAGGELAVINGLDDVTNLDPIAGNVPRNGDNDDQQ